MNTIDQAYIGLDLHASNSVFEVIDLAGNHHTRKQMSSEPKRLKQWLGQLPATRKYLAIEEGPLTQ